MASGSIEGWQWSSDSVGVVGGRAANDSVVLEVDRLVSADQPNNLKLVVPESGALRLVVESLVAELRIEFVTDGRRGDVERLHLRGQHTTLDLVAPLWPYDPTELGTLFIDELVVEEVENLRLGGDELIIERLSIHWSPPLVEENKVEHDQWDRLTILADSRLSVLKAPSLLQLQLLDRSFLLVDGTSNIQLGHIGSDTELVATPNSNVTVTDWKVEQCVGTERIHLTGIQPFEYGLLRRVSSKVESDASTVGTYEPSSADSPPPDYAKSPVIVSDWVRLHEQLLGAYCRSPKVLADARWLSYEDRRVRARKGSGEWLGLNLLRLVGYGLKTGAPLAFWVLSVVVVVAAYCFQSDTAPDLAGGYEAWRRAALLWIEGVTLPASFLSLAPATSNSVLAIDGTALRVARLVVSVPFAAFVFALQARLRLPKFSDSRL